MGTFLLYCFFLTPLVISGFYLTRDIFALIKDGYRRISMSHSLLMTAYPVCAGIFTYLTGKSFFDYNSLFQSEPETAKVYIFVGLFNFYIFVIFAGGIRLMITSMFILVRLIKGFIAVKKERP